MNFRRSGQEDVGFQMAPMIDIIFVLLLFFIITSAIQQNEKDITIALPSTKSGEPTDQGRSEIIINVAANGDLIIHNEKLSLEVLREKLEQLAKLFKGLSIPNVIVRGDKSASYGRVVEVLDICANANMRNVSFVSVDKKR